MSYLDHQEVQQGLGFHSVLVVLEYPLGQVVLSHLVVSLELVEVL